LGRLVAEFHPTLVLTFGSRARGDALKHSDLDLLIVSDAFRNIRWLDRPVMVLEVLDLPFGVDLLCYTPEEFRKKREELGIVRTAVSQGVVLVGDRNDRA
jgi:predicted nucleotidyltransferase